MRQFQKRLFLFLLLPIAVLADDRELWVSVNSLTGNPPSGAVIGVTAGSPTNQNFGTISFYVEYSDDLSNWTPLHSYDLSGTNTEPTIASNVLTLGVTALFVDEGSSQHRFYRAVVVQ